MAWELKDVHRIIRGAHPQPVGLLLSVEKRMVVIIWILLILTYQKSWIRVQFWELKGWCGWEV